MPSKIVSESRGSGMTRHTRTQRIFDMTQPLTESEASEFGKGFMAMGASAAPWRWLEHEIGVAERTIRAIEDGAPGSDDPDIFKPHAGPGWYSREILARAKWIENAKASGQWELVARFSYEVGQLAVTIRLKNAWDDDVEIGVAADIARKRGGAATRKGSDAERLACYRRYRAQGLNKSDATDQAAQELGVSPATIRNARKGAAATD